MSDELLIKEKIRKKIIDLENKKILLCRIDKLEENKDQYCCCGEEGYTRIRKYSRFNLFLCNSIGKQNKRLLRGIEERKGVFETVVFQNVGCNWKCWYCFVDNEILAVDSENTIWVSPEEMLDVFQNKKNNIMDLSGGQPDLIPEWCLWMMEELDKRNLKGQVDVWMDDNLGCIDILEKHLTKTQIQYMAQYPRHSRAVCFKGYDDSSVRFNVCNRGASLEQQIDAFKKLYNYGFDLYGYITLTTPTLDCAKEKIRAFIERMQKINYNIPLRIIPLEIKPFSVTKSRMINNTYTVALENQFAVYEMWREVMNDYYDIEEQLIDFDKVLIR